MTIFNNGFTRFPKIWQLALISWGEQPPAHTAWLPLLSHLWSMPHSAPAPLGSLPLLSHPAFFSLRASAPAVPLPETLPQMAPHSLPFTVSAQEAPSIPGHPSTPGSLFSLPLLSLSSQCWSLPDTLQTAFVYCVTSPPFRKIKSRRKVLSRSSLLYSWC